MTGDQGVGIALAPGRDLFDRARPLEVDHENAGVDICWRGAQDLEAELLRTAFEPAEDTRVARQGHDDRNVLARRRIRSPLDCADILIR